MNALIKHTSNNNKEKAMQRITTIIFMLTVIAALILSNSARAHAMVAQHGTLNYVGEHVFLLLSVPVSAFSTLDDDNDGEVSMIEFNLHRKGISEVVKSNIYLVEKETKYFIEGLLLSPTISHTEDNNNIDQITVMGRYTLPGDKTQTHFNIGVFSPTKDLQTYTISATNKKQNLVRQFELKTASNSQKVFN